LSSIIERHGSDILLFGALPPHMSSVILAFNGQREGSFVTFKLLLIDNCLSFSNLLMACLLSYLEFSYITSTSKLAMDGIPMVVTIVGDLMMSKLWADLWNSPCNPPWLPPFACTISSSIFSF